MRLSCRQQAISMAFKAFPFAPSLGFAPDMFTGCLGMLAPRAYRRALHLADRFSLKVIKNLPKASKDLLKLLRDGLSALAGPRRPRHSSLERIFSLHQGVLLLTVQLLQQGAKVLARVRDRTYTHLFKF